MVSPTQDQDSKVLTLLRVIKEKKAEIAAIERPQWCTHCSYSPDEQLPVTARVNIQALSDISALLKIHAELHLRARAYTESAQALSVSSAPRFKHQGHTIEEWSSDIKTRLNRLVLKQKQDELAELERRVNAIVSVEQRRAMEIDELTKALAV